MTVLRLTRIIQFGFSNFWRNIWLSLATTSVMILTVFSVSLLYMFTVVGNLALDTVKEKVDISIYLKTQVTDNQVSEVKSYLLSLPEVKDVEYISKEQALEKFKQKHRNNELILSSIQELSDNPLEPTLIVRARNTADYAAISDELKQSQYNDSIEKVNFEDNREVIDKLTSTTQTVNKVGVFVVGIFSVISALVIFNTIRLTVYTQRDEIRIMKLVGATNSFVQVPYIVEGLLYGIIAGLISLIVLIPITYWATPGVNAFLENQSDLYATFLARMWEIAGLQLLFGIFLGSISSTIAVRKYLKR